MADGHSTQRHDSEKPDAAILRDLYEVQYISSTEIARRFRVRRSTVKAWFAEHGIQMRRSKRIPAEVLYGLDEAKLRRLYEDEGLSMDAIADRLGAPGSVIWNCIRRAGIKARPTSVPGKGAKPKPAEDDLRRLYEVDNLNAYAIGERYGVGFNTVIRWLRGYGIGVRRGGVPKGTNSQAPDEATLRDLYEIRQLTTRQIGDRLGVSHMSVKRWLRAYKIEARPKGRGLANRGIEGPAKEELFRMLHVEHIGFRGVAEIYGVNYTAVAQWAKKLGIKPPTIWQTRMNGQQPILDPEEVGRLYESGLSTIEIAEIFGVSTLPIAAACKKAGIEMRPAGFSGTVYICDNGLEVRSSYERRVANWLIARNIEFAYEPKYPFNPRLRADFLVNRWYVEVWGVTELPSYQEKKARKIRLCEIHDIPLIELKPCHFATARAGRFEQIMSRVLTPAKIQAMLF